jgi:hypothetical protein
MRTRNGDAAVSLDSWIKAERKFALQGILANIGPAVGIGEGIIVASPSKGLTQDEPDYFVCPPAPKRDLIDHISIPGRGIRL